MALYTGTSGWSYKEWKPAFYPADLPAAKMLAYYGSRLRSCEINATFYRLASRAAVQSWMDATPCDFRFAVKAHRRLTHGRELLNEEGFWEAFDSSLEPMQPKLGAVLYQIPPYRHFKPDLLDRILRLLGNRRRWVLEIRHDSWSVEDLQAPVASAGGTLCFTDWTGEPPEQLPPGPIGYVRLRARHYSPELRARWEQLLVREAAARDVFVFVKHDEATAGDPGEGVTLAEHLGRLAVPVLGQRAVGG